MVGRGCYKSFLKARLLFQRADDCAGWSTMKEWECVEQNWNFVAVASGNVKLDKRPWRRCVEIFFFILHRSRWCGRLSLYQEP